MFWFTCCAVLIIIIIPCFGLILVKSLVLRFRLGAPSVRCLVCVSVPVVCFVFYFDSLCSVFSLRPHVFSFPVLVPHLLSSNPCLCYHVSYVVVLSSCLWLRVVFLFYFDSLVCLVSVSSFAFPSLMSDLSQLCFLLFPILPWSYLCILLLSFPLLVVVNLHTPSLCCVSPFVFP